MSEFFWGAINLIDAFVTSTLLLVFGLLFLDEVRERLNKINKSKEK